MILAIAMPSPSDYDAQSSSAGESAILLGKRNKKKIDRSKLI